MFNLILGYFYEVGIYVSANLALAESWVRFLKYGTDNSMLVQRSMGIKMPFRDNKDFHENKLCPVKTTRISQATSDRVDSKRARRRLLPRLFPNNDRNQFVQCRVINLIQTDGLNRLQEGVILPLPRHKPIKDAPPAAVLDQDPTIVVIRRMHLIMPLNILKIFVNRHTVLPVRLTKV